MYWCFHCYMVNDHATGPCDVCRRPVEAPTGLTYVDGLIWALHHPDGDRAALAAQTLGRLRASEAVQALRAVTAEDGADIYVRGAALVSVIAIAGPVPLRPWLEELADSAPFNVRMIARQTLQSAGG